MTKGLLLVWLNKCLGWCQDKPKWERFGNLTPKMVDSMFRKDKVRYRK